VYGLIGAWLKYVADLIIVAFSVPTSGYTVVPVSILHVSMALTTFLTFEQNVVSFDFSMEARYLGTAKPIKIPNAA